MIPNNKYVQKVLEHSEGLPLYVHLLVDDLKTGIRKLDDGKLPDSLRVYYDEIMSRIGLSDVRRDLTEIIATLAVSREPMERNSLAQFLANGRANWADYIERVGAALEAGVSLIRISRSEDNSEGYTTYHQSYREYLLGDDSPIKGSIVDAREKFLELSEQWVKIPRGNLNNHLFRQATGYALNASSEHQEQAARRLCDFGYLMKRLGQLPADNIVQLLKEYELLQHVLDEDVLIKLDYFEYKLFIRRKSHLLRKGSEAWPSNRILLQLALEFAEESALTSQADGWMKKEVIDWPLVKASTRPQKIPDDRALFKLDSFEECVKEVMPLTENRLLIRFNHSLQVLDKDSGQCLQYLDGHTDKINGIEQISDDSILSWSDDGTVRIWDLTKAEFSCLLLSHSGAIIGLILLSETTLLTWESRKTFRVWDHQTGSCLLSCEIEDDSEIKGAFLLPNNKVAIHTEIKIHIWDIGSALCERTISLGKSPDMLMWQYVLGWCQNEKEAWEYMERHHLENDLFKGVQLVFNRFIVASVLSRAITGLKTMVWDLISGCEFILESDDFITGFKPIPNGLLLTWSTCGTLRTWDLSTNQCCSVLQGHTGDIKDLNVFPDGRVLSWSSDATLRV